MNYQVPQIEWQDQYKLDQNKVETGNWHRSFSETLIHAYQIMESMTEKNKVMVHYYNKQTRKGEPYISCPNFDSVEEAKEWVETTHYPSALIKAGFEPVSEPLADTLVEKLEQEIESLENSFEQFAIVDNEIAMVHTATIAGLKMAINIVKQHQSWRKMPSDEKPQDMQAYNLLLKNDSSEYPTLYSVGLFRQYASGHVWLSLVEAETYIDESDILAWQPMNMPSAEFFESPKQPPREPQYLISKGGYWYRPNAKGYTASKHEAGRFSKEFAERHAKEVREVRIFEDKENR